MSELAQVWGARIDWQQRSGLTVAECCEAEGVSTASFYRWRNLLTEGRTTRPRRTARRTAPQASAAESRGIQFLPIELRESSATPDTRCAPAVGNGSSSVRIELPNGVVIHVPGDPDGQWLADVIMAAGQIGIPSSPMAVRRVRQQEAACCCVCPHARNRSLGSIDEARQVADRKRDRREQRRGIRVASPAPSQ